MASIRKLAVAAFLPLALIAPSAHAQDDVAVVVGLGTITPGLPTTGSANQHVTFGGTAVNASIDNHTGVYNIAFDGNSIGPETLGNGQGAGNLTGDVSGTVAYTRLGPIVVLTGDGQVNGAPHSIVLGVCEFVPTSVNPVEDYALACEVVLDGT